MDTPLTNEPVDTTLQESITINGKNASAQELEELKNNPKKKVIQLSEKEYTTKELLLG
jgi:hypothetical protein